MHLIRTRRPFSLPSLLLSGCYKSALLTNGRVKAQTKQTSIPIFQTTLMINPKSFFFNFTNQNWNGHANTLILKKWHFLIEIAFLKDYYIKRAYESVPFFIFLIKYWVVRRWLHIDPSPFSFWRKLEKRPLGLFFTKEVHFQEVPLILPIVLKLFTWVTNSTWLQ